MSGHNCPGDDCKVCEARIEEIENPVPPADWESDSIADDYYQALEKNRGGRHRARGNFLRRVGRLRGAGWLG